MRRRHKERIALAVAGVSLFLLLLVSVMAIAQTIPSEAVAPILMLLLLSWLGGMIAAVSYSKDGWTIKGSTFEWIIVAIFHPFLALIFYSISREQERGATVDLDDEETMRRL
jgi:hypothetical protein